MTLVANAFCLLFPFTNSDCRSSCACWRNFSFLLDCPLTASKGLTNIRSKIILRKIPDLVKPHNIMTSRHNTCRKISFDVAVAKCFALNEVNVSQIVLIIQWWKIYCGTNPVESTSFFLSRFQYFQLISSSKNWQYFWLLIWIAFLHLRYFILPLSLHLLCVYANFTFEFFCAFDLSLRLGHKLNTFNFTYSNPRPTLSHVC